MKRHCLHFVGFKDERVYNARHVFGEPDFYHRLWDVRAQQEICEGDTAVFANGTIDSPTVKGTWDASQQDIYAYEEPCENEIRKSSVRNRHSSIGYRL